MGCLQAYSTFMYGWARQIFILRATFQQMILWYNIKCLVNSDGSSNLEENNFFKIWKNWWIKIYK